MKSNFKKLLAGFATLALVVFSLAATAAAQQVTTGGIEGQVTDPQGAVVVGATVTVKNVDTGLTRTAQTDSEGKYAITQLPPGNYEVRVAGQSFKTSIAKAVGVNVGSNTALDVKLEVGGAQEEVTIVGSGEQQIERVDNTVSGVVGTVQIQNLPLNGRNFLDLAQLQPGVEKVEGSSFDPTKANYTGVSIGGQAGRSTQISVDGGSVVDNVVGTTVQNFSQEIVQEFQLGISNVDVSTGASGTGSVNIISKSGSNDYHGNGYIYWRDHRFAAFPSLSRLDIAHVPANAVATEVPFSREQFGGTLGGPIKRDKLFFFANVERNRQQGSALHNPPEAPAFAGFTANPFRETLLSGRGDWVYSTKTQYNARYSFNDNHQQVPFPLGGGAVPRPSTTGILNTNDQIDKNRAQSVVVGMTHAFSPTLTNNLVFNMVDFSNFILPADTKSPIGELRLLGSQLARWGTNYITPQTTFQERHQLRDDLTKVKGSHTIRVGGDLERTSINGQFAFAKPARVRLFTTFVDATGHTIPLTFNTEADFLNAPVRDISMGVGNDILPFNTPTSDTLNYRVQPYVNDSWKLTPRFTLNMGLAYRIDSNLWNHDMGHPPIIAPLFGKRTAPSPRDKNNWSPRVGFAWDIAGNGRTVVRGGFGMYYDTAIDNLRLFERADLGRPGAELFLVGNDIQTSLLPGGNGRFGNSVSSSSGFIRLRDLIPLLPAVRRDLESRAFDCPLSTSLECTGAVSGPLFSTEFQVPYSLQYSVGVQRELPWKLLFQGDFNYRKGVHEVLTYDANRFDSINGPRTDFPNAVPYADSSAFSTYIAGLFRLDRRFSNGFQMTSSYAISRFKAFGGDVLGLGASVTDLNDFRKEFGPAGLDRTHRLVVSAIYELPWGRKSSDSFKRNVVGGWQVSLISTAFSGVPFSVFLPNFVDLSGTGTFQTYLPGTKEGSIGRDVKNVGQLNSLISAYNSSIPHLGIACGTDSSTGRCDVFGDPIEPLATVRPNAQIGGDSLISQDLRLTKTFGFTERMKLDIIGEVFNLFNVANLTQVSNFVVPATTGDPNDRIKFLAPTLRTTSVFGTGGPRAFQFAAKFRF